MQTVGNLMLTLQAFRHDMEQVYSFESGGYKLESFLESTTDQGQSIKMRNSDFGGGGPVSNLQGGNRDGSSPFPRMPRYVQSVV